MKNRILLKKILLLLVGCLVFVAQVQADVLADAQTFWSEFRTAVIGNKHEKVASLTYFPFQTRGDFDDNPINKYDKAGFLTIYAQIFNEMSADATMTVRKRIEQKIVITEKDFLTKELIRVENLIFKKVDGKWQFTFAYIVE